MAHDPEQMKRKLAELQQRDGEDTIDCLLRIAQLNRPKGQRGKVRGLNRKNLVRRFRKMRKGSDPPIDVEHPAFVEFMRRKKEEFEERHTRQRASLIATVDAMRLDPEYFNNFPWTARPGESPVQLYRRQEAYMVNPRRQGKEGRAVIKDAATTTKRKRDRLDAVRQMLEANPKLKAAAIVAEFGCSSKTAERDLKAAKK
jgi:hypothetical protein